MGRKLVGTSSLPLPGGATPSLLRPDLGMSSPPIAGSVSGLETWKEEAKYTLEQDGIHPLHMDLRPFSGEILKDNVTTAYSL